MHIYNDLCIILLGYVRLQPRKLQRRQSAVLGIGQVPSAVARTSQAAMHCGYDGQGKHFEEETLSGSEMFCVRKVVFKTFCGKRLVSTPINPI